MAEGKGATPTRPSGPPTVVDPGLRVTLTLGLSLVMWWSTARSALDGETDVVTAGTRYLIVLVVAWVGVSLLVRLVDAYAATPKPAPEDDDAGDRPGAAGPPPGSSERRSS